MENLKYSEILKLNSQLIGTIKTPAKKIGILSNVTVNPSKEILELGLRLEKIEPDVEIGNYDNIVQDSTIFKNKDTIVIFYDMLGFVDNVSGFFEDLPIEKYEALKEKLFQEIDIIFDNLKGVPALVFNTFSSAYFVQDYSRDTLADQFVSAANEYIYSRKPANTTILNIDKIFTSNGLKDSLDLRFFKSSKAPYSVSFFKRYTQAVMPVFLRSTAKMKKAIIFDCDNTLWKGILGEDGIENIEMQANSKNGDAFNRVQQIAVFLSNRGVIIGICSKNNEKDVDEVLNSHPGMLLKDEHIVIKKVNWLDKATNLRDIAAELNIGVESMVFVDDSSFEINLIKETLPEIATLQVPSNLTAYSDMLLEYVYGHFDLGITKENLAKTTMYKQNFQRENAKHHSGSIEDYLASLQMEITIGQNNKSYIPRIAQLTQKTNQFNLTTFRYTEGQIEAFIDDKNYRIYTISVKDKFGDNGLTGTCIVKPDGSDYKKATIDSLLMSCRIIGRNIEYVFLNKVIEDLVSLNVESISSKYISTAKNDQVSAYYDHMGFQLISDAGGTKEYTLNLTSFVPKEYNYIKIIKE